MKTKSSKISAAPGTRRDPGPAWPSPAAGAASERRFQRVAAQLNSLYHMGRDLGGDENWSDALDRFLMALVNFMEADGAALLLFSDRERALSARAVFHVEDGLLDRAMATLRDGWNRHARGVEIHALESYGDRRPTSCLERTSSWSVTVIPLRHRGRALGFVLLDKPYGHGADFQWDYHFLSTLQTIFAEEIANASYISELRQLSRFNNKILDTIRSGVVTTDLDGNVRYANARATDMCPRLRRGAGGAGSVGFDSLFRSRVHKDGLFQHIVESPSDPDGMEVECHGGGREPFPARLRAAKMHDDHMNGTVVVGVFDDLTERKRMEEAIRRNDRLRALGQLSAGVAHEIRNPLAGIATTAEVLAGKLGGDEDKVRYIRAMLDEIGRLDAIVRSLLAFARPQRPQMVPCAAGEIVERVCSLLADQAAAHGVTVRTVGADVARVCPADPAQLTQVVLNLVLNAIQACRSGDVVTIGLRDEDGASMDASVVIDVTDTGPGVPEEVRGTLFEPFVTAKAQGTGLGLAICRQIVEEHRGTIACEFLEKGTRFTVRLPRLAVTAVDGP